MSTDRYSKAGRTKAGRYTKAAAKGAASGVRSEWDRVNTLGGVVEYAIVGKEARAIYAAGRVTLAATKGAVSEVRTTRSEISSEQPVELFAVPDADAPKADNA